MRCQNGSPPLEAIAQRRAQTLLQDHRRIRAAAEAKGSYQVTASLPVDVMGVYVLVPGQSAQLAGPAFREPVASRQTFFRPIEAQTRVNKTLQVIVRIGKSGFR